MSTNVGKLTYTVTKEMTAAFAKAWDLNGIKVILDSTTVQFATDWANIALKSFVADMAAHAKKVAEAKLAAQKAEQPQADGAAPKQSDVVATQTVPVPAPPRKSSIILTDC